MNPSDPEKVARKILIIGGSSYQAEALVLHLLSNPLPQTQYKVSMIPRDKISKGAKRLLDQGVQIHEGFAQNFDNMKSAMEGVYGVFIQLNPWKVGGYAKETEYGKKIIDLAKECKVQHVVYTSVAGSTIRTDNPFVKSKHEIEQYLIQQSSLRYTILKPCFFMENLFLRNSFTNGVFVSPFQPSTKVAMVSIDDIAAFGSLAFDNPTNYDRVALEIAGDNRTMEEYAKVLGVKYQQIRFDEIETGWRDLYSFFDNYDLPIEISSLHQLYPNLTSFEKFLSFQTDKLLLGVNVN